MLKNSIFGKLLIMFSFLLVSGTMSFADEQKGHGAISFKLRPAQTVVELFTSQGCSSCPPADELLAKYIDKSNVIALSYSVDYWDYLGWRDTYGKKANSDRQRDYARTRGDGSVYTPQVIVNGLEHMNGASQYKINSNIDQIRKSMRSKFVTLNVAELDDRRVRIWTSNSYQAQDGVVLWRVWVKDGAKVAIRRGENRGRNIAYHNIVLGVKKVADFSKSGLDLIIDRKRVTPKNGEHCILIAQVGATGPVLGAVEIK